MIFTTNPVIQIAVHIIHWKNIPSPVSNFLIGTKFEPKHTTATATAVKPL